MITSKRSSPTTRQVSIRAGIEIEIGAVAVAEAKVEVGAEAGAGVGAGGHEALPPVTGAGRKAGCEALLLAEAGARAGQKALLP